MTALCWPYVGLTWPYLAPMLALCSPTCTLSCPMLTLCWPKLPLSCLYVDPMFTYVGLGNALPHSSDRNGGGDDGVGTGWERGRDGVTTGGSAVGGARLYNLRLPPKASGKDTGLVAGARIIEGLPPMPPTPDFLSNPWVAHAVSQTLKCKVQLIPPDFQNWQGYPTNLKNAKLI